MSRTQDNSLPNDYFDRLSDEYKAVLRSCGVPLDLNEILEMDDQVWSDSINAEHRELSDDDHNTWLILSQQIKDGINEIKKNQTRLRDLIKESGRKHIGLFRIYSEKVGFVLATFAIITSSVYFDCC